MESSGNERAANGRSPQASFAVVVEMENAATVRWSDVGRTLRVLAQQLLELSPSGERAEVILAFPGSQQDAPHLIAAAMREVPELAAAADVAAVGVPGGRYYELKNAGIAAAEAELIVLLDSDAVPEPGWLAALLAPFADTKTAIVNGHTYLGHYDLISRLLAMVWVFPLREHDTRAAQRRSLNANNCALRTSMFGRKPFPIDNGFKVGCTKFMKQLDERGIELVRVPAYAEHAPLRGWRFLVWRALVTGRDADRKYADLRSPSRGRRFFAALRGWLKQEGRAVRRIVTHYRHVQLPWWQLPLALALGSAFFAIALVGQLWRAAGLARERPEYIPAYAESH
jgi:hypothetical protein